MKALSADQSSEKQLVLVAAGSSWVTLSWHIPEDAESESLQAEVRQSRWLLAGAWRCQVLKPEDIVFPVSELAKSSSSTTPSLSTSPDQQPSLSSSSKSEPEKVSVTVTVRALDPETAYDVRLSVQLASTLQRCTSCAATCRTLALAPSLHMPPCVKCARHDRLFLCWPGPLTQADEVVAYKVRYFDCEPRWPVKHECEIKLASKLLRPSEQTAQFLKGSVAMQIVSAAGHGMVTSDQGETNANGDESVEVHFWLTGLAPSRMYYAQVAAISIGGQGEWSPKSDPLYTWRKAPAVNAPQLLFATHASVVLGISFETLEEGCKGQDEKVDKFKVRLQPGGHIVEVSCEAAMALAARLRTHLEQEFPSADDFPSHAIVVRSLKARACYDSTVMAVTHAGQGERSSATTVETLAVPPDITEICVDDVDHCSASVSWSLHERPDFAEVARDCLAFDGFEEQDAVPCDLELGDRELRGFKLRAAALPDSKFTGQNSAPIWNEILGVRVSAAEVAAGQKGHFRLRLQNLAPNSTTLVQVSAVAHGEGEGHWSESAAIETELLAPDVSSAPELVRNSRQGAELQWAIPEDIPGAPVLGYTLYISMFKERGRIGTAKQLDLPLRVSELPLASEGCFGQLEELEGCIRARLAGLEPGMTYSVCVAAFTARGIGYKSPLASVTTRPCSPAMDRSKIQLLHSYYNRLVLQCSEPTPDWAEDEESDVLGYSVRFFECGRYVPHSSWVQVDEVDLVTGNTGSGYVQFQLVGLLPERQYVVQIAAFTPAGRGPWSEQSERLSTWCVAPQMQAPRALFRTHTSLVLGWDPKASGLDIELPACALAHDEEIVEFVVKATASTGSSRGGVSHRVDICTVDSLANAWRDASCDAGSSWAAEQTAKQVSTGLSSGTTAPMTRLAGNSSMVCEMPDGSCLRFVAVITGLLPGSTYVMNVIAVAASGEGKVSASSTEVCTLPVAPVVENAQVDEVQSDQIQISWEHLHVEPGLSLKTCERLGILTSVEELELRGYSVRCALWTTWTRLAWRDPAYAEVETLPVNEAGRVHFAVLELEPEQQYMIEVRAHGLKGGGEWCRISENAICTAVVAEAPLPPELVYATPHALAFSFAGVEDDLITAYEVRRQEGWTGGWKRPSKPLRFDRKSLAVRVTSENRWVVTMDQLQIGTPYSLQLRGVTASDGVTKWSARSEAMCTLQATDGEEVPELEVGVGVNDTTAGQAQPTNSQQHVPENPAAESVDDLSKKLEAVLSFLMEQATAGVRLPKVTIPSVAEKADELLREHSGSRDSAILAAAQIEDDASWRTKLPDFLIQQVPVVGCGTVLLRELWRNIRRCALIAQLYGHDTRSTETQALILTCLVPTSSGSPALPTTAAAGQGQQGSIQSSGGMSSGSLEDVMTSRRVALLVSRALAKETFVRATGLKSAATVVGLLEQAGLFIASSSQAGVKAALGRDASASKQSAANVPEAKSNVDLNDDLSLQELPSPVRMAILVFRPLKNQDETPLVVLSLLALWLLPVFIAAARFIASKLFPLLTQRVQMELPLAAIVGLLLAAQVFGVSAMVWFQQNLGTFVSVPATLIFVLYAVIPGISVSLATRSVLQGAREAPFFVILGLFNLTSGYLRWAGDVIDDAVLEERPLPQAALYRKQVEQIKRTLWIFLLVDFVLEELLGQVIGLHSFRILGPPQKSGVTLTEYRTLAFVIGLLAAWAQAKVLELLQRRTVLLRLLGARNTFLGGLTLLLTGAFAVVQQPKTIVFLREVSPAPWWCCMVLWTRKFGALAGALVPMAFFVLLHPKALGSLAADVLVPTSLFMGALLGYLFCQTFNNLWLEKREHLESDYRVLHLFPNISVQARDKAAVAMRMALTRGAAATKNTATQLVVARAVKTGFDFFARALARRGL
eukprot:TRINITY_DN41341_c0_g1_i1.p1 TRINITY_DN41341_c0_g1~~TRINITY_DN41341_c0_g1_i1.p1  ORF type:complete len:1899 (+),score=291.02 TRINITY_DN41341_c0_g1_i1:103-5799(+)